MHKSKWKRKKWKNKQKIQDSVYVNNKSNKSHRKPTRWHNSTIQSNRRLRKQRRYIIPKSKRNYSRVGCKSRNKLQWEVSNNVRFKSKMSKNNPQAYFDSDSFRIGIDNHSSKSISNCKRDFSGPIRPCNAVLNGISSRIKINGIGMVKWRILDDDGKPHVLSIHDCLYVPEAAIRLLSPQQWSKQSNDHFPKKNGTWCATYQDKCVLNWNQNKNKRTVMLDPQTNVAILRSAPNYTIYNAFCTACSSPNQVSNERLICNETRVSPRQDPSLNHMLNFDVSPEAPMDPNDNLVGLDTLSEFMRWHYRLGHLSYRKMKLLSSMGILPKKFLEVKPPKCAGCMFGSMTRRPWTQKGATNKHKILRATSSGQYVSVDQMESSTPGFIGHLKGILTKHRYTCATIFVDHFSRLGYVHLQKNMSSVETLHAKIAFESYAAKRGIKIRHYHADNGRFADNVFMQDIKEKKQSISFCGVNAHFQNGIAEKRIRDLQDAARRMLLHAKSRWKNAIHDSLWPYAVVTANNHSNELPDIIDASSKLERFTGVSVSPRLKSHHTWGCPIFALDENLQGSKKINKWNTRARVGINLGHSPRHASTVALVLNLQTGHVSPQFHVQFDDFFETVRPSANNPETISKWQQLAGITDEKGNTKAINSLPNFADLFQADMGEAYTHRDISQVENIGQSQDEINLSTPDLNPEFPAANVPSSSAPVEEMRDPVDSPSVNIRKSTRNRRMTQRMQESLEQNAGPVSYSSSYYEALHELEYRDQELRDDPIAYLAKMDNDTMYLHQALNEPDRDQFIKAVIKEVNDHISRGHWDLVPMSEIPQGEKVLDAVWAMKRKRNILTRKVYKWKARLNIHGGQQEYAVNYYDTYAPVVTWPAIRLLLTLSIINNWYTRQVDFVLAYPQADIEYDMHMKLPYGIELRDKTQKYCLRLKKNLYGQKNAGRTFYLYMVDGLLKLGYKQSSIDECIFYRDSTIFFTYVDDGIFMDASEHKINKAVTELANVFDIEDKGDVTEYLGVKIDKASDGTIKLYQPHLIDQIIAELNLNAKVKPRPTPAASTRILHRFKDEHPHDKTWHYRSVIGKLNYLEKSTRPDISYAVHQCARFCEDPKVSHSSAVEHIGKYLLGTRNQGIFIKPNSTYSFDVYADSDFVGNWNKITAPVDESTSKSRTGYLISFANCPLIWSSKLQTLQGLSTTECEYMALSQALRDTIPVMELLREMKRRKFNVFSTVPRVHCKAFEDNSGALELARLPKMRPRTKHINQIFHHFRSFVKDGQIKVLPIESALQKADTFTKPLPQNPFLKLRKMIMGW